MQMSKYMYLVLQKNLVAGQQNKTHAKGSELSKKMMQQRNVTISQQRPKTTFHLQMESSTTSKHLS